MTKHTVWHKLNILKLMTLKEDSLFVTFYLWTAVIILLWLKCYLENNNNNKFPQKADIPENSNLWRSIPLEVGVPKIFPT